MDTCEALVNSYVRFNGYVATREKPVLVGEGRPPTRRPTMRKPPKLPDRPSFDRPEEATTTTPPPEKKRVRKGKPRAKQPPKGELQPHIHHSGKHLKSA
jgi:hypothetical protein